jgi:hypothetical protein
MKGLTGGDTRSNSRTRDFEQLMQCDNLSLVPFESSSPTFFDARSRSSIIDFALVSAAHLSLCSPVTVHNDNGGSDHFPIMIDVTCVNAPSSPETSPAPNSHRIPTHLLTKSPRIRQAYADEVNSSLGVLLSSCRESWDSVRGSPEASVSVVQKLLDRMSDSFTSLLISAAEKHCKTKKKTVISKSSFPADVALKDLRERRVVLLRQLKTFYKVDEVRPLLRSNLNQVNRAFAKRVKELERERDLKFFDLLETKTPGEQQRIIKSQKNGKQSPGVKLLRPESLPVYTAHFSAIFGHPPNTASSATDNNRNDRFAIIDRTEFENVAHFFSAPTIEYFVRKEECGKTPGHSRVSAELMRPVAPVVAAVLSLVAEVMFCTGLCPESFKKANIIPVPKKIVSDNIENYRPISLTEVPRRIVEKCLAVLLRPFERQLSPAQCGFREQRSTMDQVATLQQVLSTRYRGEKSTVVALLDIKSAYDCVNRELLWECCGRAGIPSPVVKMLSGMFDYNESQVIVDGFNGEWFPNHMGLLQGSSLSPLLYAIYIDDLPRTLLNPRFPFPSLPLGNSRVNCLLYADDIALVADSVESMQILLDYCTVFAHGRQFKWGISKCEVLLSRIDTPSPSLMLQHKSLNVNKTIKYLGVFFDKKGIDTNACVDKLGESIDKAAGALFAIGLEPHCYPLHIIAKHLKVFVRSCGEYALGVLPLNKGHIDKLESHQYWAVKRFLKTKAQVSMEKLLASLGLETVESRYNTLSAKWYNRVVKLDETNFLVKSAWVDFSKSLEQHSKSSSFYFPAKANPLILNFYTHCASLPLDESISPEHLSPTEPVTLTESLSSPEPVPSPQPPTDEPVAPTESPLSPESAPLRTSSRPRKRACYRVDVRQKPALTIESPALIEAIHRKHIFAKFLKPIKADHFSRILLANQLPVPPNGQTIVKTLHSLGVHRSRLRFTLMWILNCVPFAGRECHLCKEGISKTHLESCAVQSRLPPVAPGKGLDTLFYKALTQLHAPSALLAVNVLYDEVRRAFPKRKLISD